MISVLKVPTSTSIFSAISASIFKISVPIIKRRSWGFRNTPRSQVSDQYWPRKQQKQSGTKTACLKLNKTPIFEDLPLSLNCCNLAQNNPNFASTSSPTVHHAYWIWLLVTCESICRRIMPISWTCFWKDGLALPLMPPLVHILAQAKGKLKTKTTKTIPLPIACKHLVRQN